jgi:methyl-accepting chemotaxis protein
MTDTELGVYLANLAATAASNTEAITRQSESIRELRTTMTEGFESQARSIEFLREGFESQSRSIESLREGFESQARSVESLRESVSYNTETMAASMELAASSQRTAAASMETAAAAMEVSANTSRNLDRLEQDISELKQMLGILIRDNQADRNRITRLEDQN